MGCSWGPAGVEIEVRTIDRSDVREPEPHLRDVGDGEIAIDLRPVSVNGRRYDMNAEDLTGERLREEPGVNSRTAKFVGGGAVFSAILGALAGGGEGAAIGALAGGGPGAATQVLTRGRALQIPPETVLQSGLERSLYLYH